MAVDIRLSAEARDTLAVVAREILGISEIDGLYVGDGLTIAHDIVNAPMLTVEVTKILSPEEYDAIRRAVL